MALLDKRIEKSVRVLKLAAEMSREYYGQPMIICYSGGKDSDVLLHLAETHLGKDDFEVLNSHTTVDAPETDYHIREVFERLKNKGIEATIRYPTDKDGKRITMWSLIVEKEVPPTRFARYCCSVLKETATPNRMAILGVRSDESHKRKGRDIFGVNGNTYKDAKFFSFDHTREVYQEAKDRDPIWDCTLIKAMRTHNNTVVNAIYNWSDADVWEYIRQEKIKTNPLYECGYIRVGCIGCPLASYSQKVKEFNDYPKYEMAYKRAFQRMIDKRISKGKTSKNKNWIDGQGVFDWWISEYKDKCRGQMTLDDYV